MSAVTDAASKLPRAAREVEPSEPALIDRHSDLEAATRRGIRGDRAMLSLEVA